LFHGGASGALIRYFRQGLMQSGITFHKMTHPVAKCGCDCPHCPTYKENIRTPEGRKKCSAGWNTYLGIKLSPEKLRACAGCSLPDAERKTYYLNCAVRKCALINGVAHCAYCTGFPCEELMNVHSLQKINSREAFVGKTGKEISAEDYARFVEPHTGLDRLNKIRLTLNEKEITDYKRFSTKTNFASSDVVKDPPPGLKIIHSLLTTVFVESDISYARLQTLNSKREKILKILWTMGLYGSLEKDHNRLVLDAGTFLSHKIPGTYPKFLALFAELTHRDLHFEIVPLADTGWLTPSGALRKEGWKIGLAFGKSLKGQHTLILFKEYVQKLAGKHGTGAFRVFKKADLSIMTC